MPQQLIYTSAPRGLVAGRSGHCTVARSASMREALMLLLEKLSYYQHLSLSGGRDRPIFASRIGDIRGSRYHILSRIQDAGLDFTGRTNFIAHHLVFTPDEIRRNALPPVILNDWRGWAKSWTAEPELLENEDWSGLTILASGTNVPAKTWRLVTGDAVNGYGLLEARNGASFRVDDQSDEILLKLVAESLELLEVREPRKDFRAAAWEYTFTSSMQEQDNPADFRWRFIHSDNPSASRFVAPDCRPLTAARAAKWTAEETAFARVGRQPPRFVVQPQPNTRSDEGEPVRLKARAEGVPSPSYQWFVVDRTDNGQVIPHANESELLVQNPPLGVSRYVVRASNSQGQVTSEVAKVSVESKLRLGKVPEAVKSVSSAGSLHIRSEGDIERQRRRLEADKAEEMFQRKLRRKKILAGAISVILAMAVLGVVFWLKWPKSAPISQITNPATNAPSAVAQVTNPSTVSAESKEPKATNETMLAETTPETNSPVPKKNSSEDLRFQLPSGWTTTSIGNVSNGRAESVGSRFDLSGGAAGFSTDGDSVLFVWTNYSASTFQMTFLKGKMTSSKSLCGIMMRESKDPKAQFLFIGASSERILIYWRDRDGRVLFEPQDIPKEHQKKQIHFQFALDGSHITPRYSYDSKVWKRGNTDTVHLNGLTMVGLAISSGNILTNMETQFISNLVFARASSTR